MSRNNLITLILNDLIKQPLTIISSNPSNNQRTLQNLYVRSSKAFFIEAPNRFEILIANPVKLKACSARGIAYGMKAVGHGLF